MRTLRARHVVLAVAVVAALLNFTRDAIYTARYAGMDLIGYILGGLRLLDGKDPYFFHAGGRWAVSYSVTLPPPLLACYGLLGNLVSEHWRGLYLVLQWAALLLGLRLLTRSEKDEDGRALVWAYGLVFLAGSHGWALHTERGQKFVFFVLLLAVAYDLVQRGGAAREWAAGVLLGVAVAVRPSLAPEERANNGASLVRANASLLVIWQLFTGHPPPAIALPLTGAALALAGGLWIHRYRRGSEENSSLFLIMGVIAVVTDSLLPAPRLSYVDVMWLVPLALILGAHARHGRTLHPAGLLLVLGTLTSWMPWTDGNFILAGELLVALYLVITAALVLRERSLGAAR